MKNVFRNSTLGLVLIVLVGCGSTRKASAPSVQGRALDEIVMAKRFKVDVEWVRPLLTNSLSRVMATGLQPPGSTVSQINVMGNGNYLKMEGDTVMANLPYYGERQMGGGFNSDAGIRFEGVPTDLEIDKDEAKQRYDIKFTISEDVETYQVQLALDPNSAAAITINSSQRTTIRFEGVVSKLDEAVVY